MSRIHEALKKAEQERAAGLAPEPPAPVVVPEATKKAEQERAADSGSGTPSAVLVEATAIQAPELTPDVPQDVPQDVLIVERPAMPITLETLLARCPQRYWSPDAKSLLFLNSHNHVHGAEEFRTLRSRLYQMRDRQPLRTVLIASVLPREGKTFTTANLAQAIVRQHERHALVIDGDLRRSQLHLPFGAPSTPGLTDYLSGEADEFSIIQRGAVENLFLIPGGKPVSNPAELLSNGRLKILLDRLAPVFDWILVDSPPAVAVSDASVLADVCDGVLLVVQAASTPFDVAQKAREEFREKGLLGVVLNRVEPAESYVSYYYSYYHKQPSGKKT